MILRHPALAQPMTVAKIASNPEITCREFIRDMLDLLTKNVTILEK